MKILKGTSAGFAALLMVLAGTADGDQKPKPGKSAICHVPPGNPAKAKTLHLPEGAITAHLRHGDSIGPCQSAGASGDAGASRPARETRGQAAPRVPGRAARPVGTSSPAATATKVTPPANPKSAASERRAGARKNPKASKSKAATSSRQSAEEPTKEKSAGKKPRKKPN